MKQEKKKMTAKNKAKKCLANKQDQLNWSEFNFLENLLIFCTLPEKVVPEESGVQFRITLDKNSGKKELCLLFEIDRKHDQLIQGDKQKRPDYLCFYVNENTCICTIIEMKGRNQNVTKGAIDQIINLKKILQEQLSQYFPTKLKIKYQALLLTRHNAQLPTPLIQQQEKNGFIILPLQYNEQFQLYDYICQTNNLKQQYKHRKIIEAESLLLETILIQKALPKRLSNYSEIERKTHIYIDYLYTDDLTLITLIANNNQIDIRLSSNNNQRQLQKIIESLQKDLDCLKLPKISYSQSK
jgi:hypothetical protein